MDTGFIVVIATIIIGCLVGLLHYCKKKSKALRLLGYDIVYYYVKQCGTLVYYRSKNRHIENVFFNSHYTLKNNCNKWFLMFGSKRIVAKAIAFYEKADSFTRSISPFYSVEHYFAYSESQKIEKIAKELEKDIQEIINDECRKYLTEKNRDDDFPQFSKKTDNIHRIQELRETHNEEFVKRELRLNKEYFDTILKYPLDPQQRESIVRLEDNCLVISSAGSGKTSTSIAKVKYLLDKRNLKKEEILVLSYNRKTAQEFQERLNVPELTCRTFHKFACEIIAQVEGRFPDVAEASLLHQCYHSLIRRDNEFKAAVTEYVGSVADLTKYEHFYDSAEKYFDDRAKYGILAPYGDMNGNPVYTRSIEEKKICIWLSEHGIDFKYEQPYPIDTASQFRRQYKPDFTIYYEVDGKRSYAFLEHFGINRNGDVPKWFGEGNTKGFNGANWEYRQGIEWKRNIHRANHTCLLETTSAMFHDRSVFRKLEEQLRKLGIVPRELSEDEKYNRLFKRNESMEENLLNLFSSFISLMKSNGKSFDEIMQTIVDSKQPKAFCNRCRYLMFKVIKPLYDEYERTLARNMQRDFTDIILCAANLCNLKRYEPRFSYILVDEFQDISVDRYLFLASLRNLDPLTKMYCVGDDWQSIYRFSGSDMNLFNHFEEYFGFTTRCKIETTYRFGNPLLKRSSDFILKNPSQVEKTVRPFSDKIHTELSFVPFSRESKKTYLDEIKKLLYCIPCDETVMLIARYNHEVNIFPSNCVTMESPTSKRATITYANRPMTFMSVHAAKGLEADNVIILNCSQDGGGFPSRITDDPILGYVQSKIDNYEYSEERRLFYVAITRAKKHTFVMYNEAMPSFFVTEMTEKDDDQQLRCPLCKKGLLKVVRQGPTSNDRWYKYMMCSNSVAGCRYNWTVFYDNEPEVFTRYQDMVRQIEQAWVDDQAVDSIFI